jgi:hypothetical protein
MARDAAATGQEQRVEQVMDGKGMPESPTKTAS